MESGSNMAGAVEQLPPPQYPSPLERERETASFIASEMAALLYTQRRIDAKKHRSSVKSGRGKWRGD